MAEEVSTAGQPSPEIARERYTMSMQELKRGFEAGTLRATEYVRARTEAVDALLGALWDAALDRDQKLGQGIALLATGGYGRRELFPYSDVDLMIVMGPEVAEAELKQTIRWLSEQMWDAGTRFAPLTRRLAECERANPDNLEFGMSLFDSRHVAGEQRISDKLLRKLLPKQLQKDAKLLRKGLIDLTRARHAKFGNTLFHLEPNVKECPGGSRDTHAVRWLARLQEATPGTEPAAENRGVQSEFDDAVTFLCEVRCFLHLRHERDDNVLDWQAQDRAAEGRVGIAPEDGNGPQRMDAAYWMRIYFRNARTVERRLALAFAQLPQPAAGLRLMRFASRREPSRWPGGFQVQGGRVALSDGNDGAAAGSDPETVLTLFAEIARTGILPDAAVEASLLASLPLLAARLEDGIGLWHRLREILLQRHAGAALRAMHAAGLLDLLLPEFHGIDALVIRDAYHRYTVDEHTFVLIDTLHALGELGGGGLEEWSRRFRGVLEELPHRELLYLAALLHDTGKARSTGDHTQESARLTASVLDRLELEPYEAKLVLDLVQHHLEMSATLRRDIFDVQTIRAFAGKVQTQEALRMLVLFTYADLNAVHPDALTPWKAENLWRLYIATSNYLDHSVDDERIGSLATALVARVTAALPGHAETVAAFVEGFPERYVRTRSAEQIRKHFEMAQRFDQDPVQLDFRYSPMVNELVLVTLDRALLFANVSGVLAAWGMNIVTADAFSNRQGTIVDSFRFTDNFRTLEMNETERDRFVQSVRDVVSGRVSVEKLLSGRRRARRKTLQEAAEPTCVFNDQASSQSTLLELVSGDTPGLLRSVSLTLAAHQCNIEVALVDTEGETAIDVFYLTKAGRKLEPGEKTALAEALREAIVANAF